MRVVCSCASIQYPHSWLGIAHQERNRITICDSAQSAGAESMIHIIRNNTRSQARTREIPVNFKNRCDM